MQWEPDPELARLLTLIVTDLREPLVQLQREAWPRIENDFAARRAEGLIEALREAAERTVETVADGFVSTVLPRVVEFSGGRLPDGAADWMRSAFDREVGATASELAHLVTGRPTVRKQYVGAALRSVEERLTEAVAGRRRRLEIQLQSLELSRRLRPDRAAGGVSASHASDVFISYASEDGADVARPLAAELGRRGFRVWIDQTELRIGDSLLDTIERGLTGSRFGVVILSPAFLARRWPRRELNALATLADSENRKVILPVWHGLDRAALVEAGALFLADVYAMMAADGVERVADAIERELREPV
jgi:hypothetical protein